MIRGLAAAGVTILLTTQYLDEADQLAERIAVIDQGRKIAEGTSRELKAATGAGMLHVALADPGRLDEAAALLEARLGAAVARERRGRPARGRLRLGGGGRGRGGGAGRGGDRADRLRHGLAEPRRGVLRAYRQGGPTAMSA